MAGVLCHLRVVDEVLVHREGDPRRQRHEQDVADGAREPAGPETCVGKNESCRRVSLYSVAKDPSLDLVLQKIRWSIWSDSWVDSDL